MFDKALNTSLHKMFICLQGFTVASYVGSWIVQMLLTKTNPLSMKDVIAFCSFIRLGTLGFVSLFYSILTQQRCLYYIR